MNVDLPLCHGITGSIVSSSSSTLIFCRELPGEKKQTLFEVEDEKALDEAKAVVAIARNARQFTDVKNFSLRCLTCQTPLKGQEDARSHAGKTGHTNFGEV